MPGPAGLVAPLLLPLLQLLEGAAAGRGRSAARPLLLAGLGPVGTGDDLDELALELLEPAALFIALFAEEQVAAVGALLGRARAAAETEWAVLDRNRDALPLAAASQIPLPLISGQAMAMGRAPAGLTVEVGGHAIA